MMLLKLEFSKLFQLTSLRVSVVLMILLPFIWAYAPGIFKVYGFYLVSAYQVPALSLLSSMQFLLPLLIAIASAELIGIEVSYGTLPTVLLRPVSRARWLLSKIAVALSFPVLLLIVLFVMSLLAGAPQGFGSFLGGTGLGQADLVGVGTMMPGAAMSELIQAYFVAAISLMPVALLAICLTVWLMNAAAGALATLTMLIFMQLLIIFPWLEPFLLGAQLSAYASPDALLGRALIVIVFYSAALTLTSVVLFERKDF